MTDSSQDTRVSVRGNRSCAALLLMPLVLSQLVLQGGDRLAGPYLHRLSMQAHLDGAGAETEYLAVLFGVVVLCELTILVPSVIWWQVYGAVAHGGRQGSTTDMVRNGLRIGVPYALAVYAGMWWTQSNPGFLEYTGFVGPKMPYYLVIACVLGSFAALCEELYFRRVLLTAAMAFLPASVAIGVNTLLFAAWHPHAYGHPGHMVAIVAGGICYSVMLIHHNSVIPGTICHALVNVFAVLLTNTDT